MLSRLVRLSRNVAVEVPLRVFVALVSSTAFAAALIKVLRRRVRKWPPTQQNRDIGTYTEEDAPTFNELTQPDSRQSSAWWPPSHAQAPTPVHSPLRATAAHNTKATVTAIGPAPVYRILRQLQKLAAAKLPPIAEHKPPTASLHDPLVASICSAAKEFEALAARLKVAHCCPRRLQTTPRQGRVNTGSRSSYV